MSFALILPFLRPIARFIEDPDVSEIMVNPGGRVFVERDGEVTEIEGVQLPEKSLLIAVRNIARTLGDDISEERPVLDARLPDGSRVAAVVPPCSPGGTTLTIRKFHARFFTVDELVRVGTMAPRIADTLRGAIERRENILISGGTSSGKTTMLNALGAWLPDADRIVVIEDTVELRIDKRDVVPFEARRAQPGLPAVTIRDLLRATMRHRPDRIIVGEVRGGEAYDLLQALNTGHDGSLSTIHASSAEQALNRLSSCAMQAEVEMPYGAVRQQIAESIQVVLHLTRIRGVRKAAELVRVWGYLREDDRFRVEVIP